MSQPFTEDHLFVGEGNVPLITDESGQPYVRTVTAVAGSPSFGYTSDVGRPCFTLGMDAQSEVQNLCVSWGNILSLDIDTLRYVEFDVRLSVALGAAASVAFGLASERNDAIDTIAEALLFRAIGNATVVVESDDGTNNNDDVATGQTLAAVWKRCGISFSEGGNSDVRFYMDNADGRFVRVAKLTTFDLSNYSNSLQFYAQIQKTSGTNLGSLQVSRFRYRLKLS